MKRLSNFTMSQILNLSDEREVVENCVNTLEDLSYFEKNCKALSDTDGMIEGFTRVLKAGIVAEGDNLQGGSLFLDPPLLGLEGRISMLGAIVNISYYGDDSVKATLFHSPGLMACLVRILLMAGLGQEVSEENVITLDEGSRVAGAELPVAVIGAEAIRKEASDYEREGTRMDGVGVWVVTVILNISCCDEVRMRLVEQEGLISLLVAMAGQGQSGGNAKIRERAVWALFYIADGSTDVRTALFNSPGLLACVEEIIRHPESDGTITKERAKMLREKITSTPESIIMRMTCLSCLRS